MIGRASQRMHRRQVKEARCREQELAFVEYVQVSWCCGQMKAGEVKHERRHHS
jgi:hypothetical protein